VSASQKKHFADNTLSSGLKTVIDVAQSQIATVDDKARRCRATGRKRYSSRKRSGPFQLQAITKPTPFTHPREKKETMSPSIIASRSQSPEQDFLAFGEDFIKSPEHLAASTQSIDFDGLLDSPLLLHEDLAAGCGGMLWPAGMRMAKYLLNVCTLALSSVV
jgi:hypothetical protein